MSELAETNTSRTAKEADGSASHGPITDPMDCTTATRSAGTLMSHGRRASMAETPAALASISSSPFTSRYTSIFPRLLGAPRIAPSGSPASQSSTSTYPIDASIVTPSHRLQSVASGRTPIFQLERGQINVLHGLEPPGMPQSSRDASRTNTSASTSSGSWTKPLRSTADDERSGKKQKHDHLF
ncbi:hypothetical protein C8J57DRAFT_1279195 [Mycena rebaudengoi]|nr:hypothetical protein C8J57DRAFT_1279195 [Mycena rebaudengoi]